MKPIRSYLPEIDLLKDKHGVGARILHEDCVVLDVQNGYRVIACRGEGLEIGAHFPSLCGLSDSDMSFWEAALCRHRRVLFNTTRGAALCFSELAENAGVLIVLLLHLSATDFLSALRSAEHNDIAVSPSLLSQPLPSAGYSFETREILDELFFYMDRILANRDIGIMTRSLLIANFTGCQIDSSPLPVEHPPLSRTDEVRLTAFLFCVFLSLRSKNGNITATGVTHGDSTKAFRYRISVTTASNGTSSAKKKAANPLELPFLTLPAFCDFSATVSENGIVLHAALPIKQTDTLVLHSAISPRGYLCIELTKAG